MPELVEPSEPYLLGDLNIDYAQSRVTVAGRPVVLTGLELEYRILAKVLEVPNRRLPGGAPILTFPQRGEGTVGLALPRQGEGIIGGLFLFIPCLNSYFLILCPGRHICPLLPSRLAPAGFKETGPALV